MKNSLSNNEAQKILDESQGLTFEEKTTELYLPKLAKGDLE